MTHCSFLIELILSFIRYFRRRESMMSSHLQWYSKKKRFWYWSMYIKYFFDISEQLQIWLQRKMSPELFWEVIPLSYANAFLKNDVSFQHIWEITNHYFVKPVKIEIKDKLKEIHNVCGNECRLFSFTLFPILMIK